MINSNGVLRVLISGSNQATIRDLKGKLVDEKEIKVVGQATTCSETLLKAKELESDFILLLVENNNGNGHDSMDTVLSISKEQNDTKIVLLASNPVACLIAAIKAGVSGVVPLNIQNPELIKALRIMNDVVPG
ncbi:MAG: hypothetical protein NTV30_09920 [Chloroflexi bacterium]|nr:hypothetical protein [Chloroflexota bacterium]